MSGHKAQRPTTGTNVVPTPEYSCPAGSAVIATSHVPLRVPAGALPGGLMRPLPWPPVAGLAFPCAARANSFSEC
jgi:hypothetical protein